MERGIPHYHTHSGSRGGTHIKGTLRREQSDNQNVKKGKKWQYF